MFLSLNYIQSDLHGWVWPWKTKPSLINDESLVSFNTFIELFRSRAQITKEKKYRIGSPTFKILTNTKCFPEIHHFHLKNLGITISQTLMATNSPLFSMMFTVTWDTRCQLIGWLVRGGGGATFNREYLPPLPLLRHRQRYSGPSTTCPS